MDKTLREQIDEFKRDTEKSHEVIAAHRGGKHKDPEFYEYNKVLRDHGFAASKSNKENGGLPPIDKLGTDMEEYFTLCDDYDQIPSLKSMCLYLGISTPMYVSFANNPASEYSYLLRGGLDYIHSILENRALNNKINSAVYMFTAQNFYGMDNVKKVDIHTNVSAEINTANAQETLNALKRELIAEKKKKDSKVKFVRSTDAIVIRDVDDDE